MFCCSRSFSFRSVAHYYLPSSTVQKNERTRPDRPLHNYTTNLHASRFFQATDATAARPVSPSSLCRLRKSLLWLLREMKNNIPLFHKRRFAVESEE